MPSLSKILLSTLKQIYYQVGFVLATSIIWFFALLPIFTIGPVTAGIYYVMNRVARQKYVTISDTWTGIRMFWQKGLALFFLQVLALAFIGANLYIALGITEGILFAAVAFFLMYCLLFVAMMSIYIYPLLVHQDPDLRTLLKHSAFLVVDNLSFSLAAVLANLVIIIFFTLFPPVAVIFLAGIISLLGNNLLLELLEQYE